MMESNSLQIYNKHKKQLSGAFFPIHATHLIFISVFKSVVYNWKQ